MMLNTIFFEERLTYFFNAKAKGVKFVEETVISTHFMRMLKMTLIQITQRETELCYKLGATVT
jgi:hypothetical protein